MTVLVTEIENHIATLTLNRPQAMNALNRELRLALVEACAALEANDDVRVVILTGSGGRAFTAGLDLKELGADDSALAAAGGDADDNPCRAIGGLSKPVIGAINGVAITGGFELALACDVLIASETARFADTHARVGIMPGWGLSQKLARIIGPGRARELSFTGNFLDAATAERWGLVNRVVAAADLMPAAAALAQDMASIDPAFLARYKALINDGFALPLGEGLMLEAARSGAANAAVSAADVAAARGAVTARGRTQG
ncbi:MAG: enoyl-CoA hydratase [Polymorphobacter sp.]|uniref:enoyl-CoA hydratase n=1 Tax=Polymorphobacter sp. TaxID=1909290 RepID=UPI003A8A8A5D